MTAINTQDGPGAEDLQPKSVGFQEAIRRALNKYAVFRGRASRSEYWWFALFNILVSIAAGILDSVLFGNENSVLNALATLALLLPSLAVSARRLHDIDRTAWWLLLWLVPVIGWIVLIIFFILRGNDGHNRFG